MKITLDIPTAIEARSPAYQDLDEAQKQAAFIAMRIKGTIRSGGHQVRLTGRSVPLHPAVQEALTAKGYEVITNDDPHDPGRGVYITW